MKNWDDDDGSPYCSVKEDFMDGFYTVSKGKVNMEESRFRNYFFKSCKITFELL